jgi:hypothetical protein
MNSPIRRCAALVIAAGASLLVVAPTAYGRFPVRISPLRANMIHGQLNSFRSDLLRDRSAMRQQLSTNLPAASLRNGIFDVARDRSVDHSALRVWSMGPYAGYMNMGYGGYGGYGGSGGYGGGYGGGASMTASDSIPVVMSTMPTEQGPNVFDALGLPSRNGHIDWPLGLRVLSPGPESRELRRQIEGQLQAAASGGSSPQLIAETGRTVGKLRGLLADLDARDRLAPNTAAEATAFLKHLDDVLKMFK